MEEESSHGAQPEQKDSFEKGHEQKPDPPEENLEPDFARGEREGEPDEEEGTFAEGQEKLPDSPEKHVEGRFSAGIEESPTSE